jgi:hypothetical protein
MVNHRALPTGCVCIRGRMNSRSTEHRRPNLPLHRTRGEALPTFAGMVSAPLLNGIPFAAGLTYSKARKEFRLKRP